MSIATYTEGEYVVAIDLGGTKVIAAVADHEGSILAERTEPTAAGSPSAVLDQLRGLVRDLPIEAGIGVDTVSALSIGVPGTVDPGTGEVQLAYNIPGLNGLSLSQELSVLKDEIEIRIENDVKAATLGEGWQGSAKDSNQFAFVAVGTGIGAGMVVDGKLCHGFQGAAGEIGYLPLGRDPFDLGGFRAPFEEAVSGRGVVAEVDRQLAAGGVSELGAGSTAAEVFSAASAGDQVACAAVDRAARLIATAVAVLAAVVAPEMVVLGGGIGANELLLEPVREYVGAITPLPLRVESSALGPRAGLIGALALALEAVGKVEPQVLKAGRTTKAGG